jgi:hypothetical protein
MRKDARIGIKETDYRIEANGCWTWLLCIRKDGYGKLKVGGKTLQAHRYSFFVVIGFYPKELDHTCRNRSCINPAHLEPVTKAQNIRRAKAKLTCAIVASMREQVRNGRIAYHVAKEVAEEFGVHPMTAWWAATGKTWKSPLVP